MTNDSSSDEPGIDISDDGRYVEFSGVPGKTPLETLKSLVPVETEWYEGTGEFVTSIDGEQAKEEETFWAFYRNGSFSDKGAGNFVAEEGDEFTFQLQEITQLR